MAYGIQAVPEVVHAVEAANATHPVCVVKFVVASEHNYSLQVPVVAVPVGATQKQVPSVPAFPQPVYVV